MTVHPPPPGSAILFCTELLKSEGYEGVIMWDRYYVGASNVNV